jgi:hypothetical protein
MLVSRLFANSFYMLTLLFIKCAVGLTQQRLAAADDFAGWGEQAIV